SLTTRVAPVMLSTLLGRSLRITRSTISGVCHVSRSHAPAPWPSLAHSWLGLSGIPPTTPSTTAHEGLSGSSLDAMMLASGATLSADAASQVQSGRQAPGHRASSAPSQTSVSGSRAPSPQRDTPGGWGGFGPSGAQVHAAVHVVVQTPASA